MTAAAGFEIASAGHSALGTLAGGPSVLGQGQGLTSVPGAIFASAAANPISSTTPGADAGSFRTGWQNLLASMEGESSPTGSATGVGVKDGPQQGASSQTLIETSSTAGTNGSASLPSAETLSEGAALPSSLPVQTATNQTDQIIGLADKAGQAPAQQTVLNGSAKYAAGSYATGATSASNGKHSARETKKEAASNQTSADTGSTAITQGVTLPTAPQPSSIVVPIVDPATLPQASAKASSSALTAISEKPSSSRDAQSTASLPTGNTEFAAAPTIAADASGKSIVGTAYPLQSASATGTSASSSQPGQALPAPQAQTSQGNFASAAQGTNSTPIGAFAATGRALRDQQVGSTAVGSEANPVTQTSENAFSQASRLATTSFPTAGSDASNSSSTGSEAAPSRLSSINSNENSPILSNRSDRSGDGKNLAQPTGSVVAQGASNSAVSASVSMPTALSGSQPLGRGPAENAVKSAAITANGVNYSAPTPAAPSALNPGLQSAIVGTQAQTSKPTSSLPQQRSVSASDAVSGAVAKNPSNLPIEATSSQSSPTDTAVAGNSTVPTAVATAQTGSLAEPSATSRNERSAKPSAIKSARTASASSDGTGIAHAQTQTAAASGAGTAVTPTPAATAAVLGNHKSSATGNSATSDGTSTTTKTFAALDSESPVGTPTWVSTGVRQAEAGYKDPELGWVGVQAKSSGGVVHASIVPGSTSAAEALSGHLAGLNTFLAENRTTLGTLSVTAPEGRSTSQGMDHGANQGQGQGTGQGTGQEISQNQGASTGQGSGQGAPTEQYFAPQAIATASTTADSSTVDGSGSIAGNTASQSVNADGNGAHISVMA